MSSLSQPPDVLNCAIEFQSPSATWAAFNPTCYPPVHTAMSSLSQSSGILDFAGEFQSGINYLGRLLPRLPPPSPRYSHTDIS